MAGHSQFKNIMYRKGAQDKKRAKIFTRLTRELQIAAKAGDDPGSNPALRSAIRASSSSSRTTIVTRFRPGKRALARSAAAFRTVDSIFLAMAPR